MRGLGEGRWEVSIGEEGYPDKLLELANPPEVVYGVGSPEALDGPCISIVGARRATPYGIAIARMAGRCAAECGVCVVSGGAMGCDAAAGRGCLEAGGRTVVVSGCGADHVYPRSSKDVFSGAAERGGAVIAAERWGMGPRRHAFPKRNALIAALSDGLIVTEAGPGSGTMSTADAALELGRNVYAIPGSIFSRNSKGTNGLVSEGARIIPDEESLRMAISMDYGSLLLQESGANEPAGPVLAALVASPLRPEELAASLGEDVLCVLKTLTDYEARDIVERLPDGRYSPTAAYFMGHNG